MAELTATPLVGARARVLLRLRSGEPVDDVLIAMADEVGADHARWTALLAWAPAEGLAARQPVRLGSGQVVEATAARRARADQGR